MYTLSKGHCSEVWDELIVWLLKCNVLSCPVMTINKMAQILWGSSEISHTVPWLLILKFHEMLC